MGTTLVIGNAGIRFICLISYCNLLGMFFEWGMQTVTLILVAVVSGN
jgi:hypothetical protein